jgi:hypothetical protein
MYLSGKIGPIGSHLFINTETQKKMKKSSLFMIVLLACGSSITMQAEDKERTNNLKIGAEFGYDVFFGDHNLDRLRKDKSSYYYGNYYDDYYGYEQALNVFYTGIKSEYFVWRNRIGFASGIRLSMFATDLNPKKDCLWLLNETDSYTDLVRIRDITQNSYYIGIPLEIRFFSNNRELPFQSYVKIGGVFNCRLATTNSVTVKNPAMRQYEETISNQLGHSENFNMYFYNALGFKIARYPWFNIEIHLPNIMVNRRFSSMMNLSDGGSGFGVQFSVQLPVGKSHPMGTVKY